MLKTTLYNALKMKNFSSYEEIVDWFEQYDLEEIGNGLFSQVYSKSNLDYVIKVYTEDKGYFSFLKFIKQEKSLFLPKIYRILKKKIEGQNVYFVCLEKLVKSCDLSRQKTRYILKKYFNISHPDCIENILENTDTLPKETKSLVFKLKDFEYANDIAFDLHGGNIMFRKLSNTIIPVLTDPFMP